MAAPAAIERSVLPSAVRELAGELLPQAPRLAREMNEHLFAMMAELRDRDDGVLPDETRASCEVNIPNSSDRMGSFGPGGPYGTYPAVRDVFSGLS